MLSYFKLKIEEHLHLGIFLLKWW